MACSARTPVGSSERAVAVGTDAGQQSVLRAEAWTEADRLFHAEPRWLGGDGAYSIDLGNERVLWLFADSFIATSAALRRSESRMVHSSVAIQQGRDPTSAGMAFYWRETAGQPQSFFPESGTVWHWPSHGALVDHRLLIFCMRLVAASGGLGFDTVGSVAVAIDDPAADPRSWQLQWLALPVNALDLIYGSAVFVDGDRLYAYSATDAANHDLYLVRWTRSQVLAGDLLSPEWWRPDLGQWTSQQQLTGRPLPALRSGQTELSVHAESHVGGWLEVQTEGFGASSISTRRAGVLTGPWLGYAPLFTPPEATRPNVLLYAAKAHPELMGAELVITYASNSTDFAELVNDVTLYFPRFVRVRFERAP